MKPPRVLPVGDAAVTVELGESLDPATNHRVRALDRALRASPFAGLRETAPTLRSLLVLYDPAVAGFAAVRRELRSRAGGGSVAAEPLRRHEVPTRYGGDCGEDLEPLARSLGVTVAELVRRHASVDYTALMLGFTPGFAYLGLLPDGLSVPRQATPRVRVPAGSVGLAGRMTGVYPVASPGGWQIVGRTSWRLFDPWREEPARIAAGDRVRFVPVEELPDPEPAPRVKASAHQPPALEVIDPGLLTTVQDAGRTGWRRYGVAPAGAADSRALVCANRAVGNPETAAALECTLVGPTLRFLRPLRFAVAGADLGAVLERADLGVWPVPPGAAVLARPGNVLRFRGRVCGCRAVVALAGGLQVPVLLGSGSTDLQSGFGGHGGRALLAGDTLAVSDRRTAEPLASPAETHADRVTLRVVPGP
ncbi:MAG TPA: 5-oxoprolinase subunit PxpB, partial [Vicinamibacteria bacterium]|nr:5-oxoprolinase subunit PxpB [Vicinamibacteria bacterium]